MSTKEKYKALISTLLNAWGGKTTVKAAKSVEINGKFHNPVAVVVESWVANDGTSWYRKYSDGWIEQGGRLAPASGAENFAVTFPVAFANAQYSLLFGVETSSDHSANWIQLGGLSGRTVTGFTAWAEYDFKKSWYACGY